MNLQDLMVVYQGGILNIWQGISKKSITELQKRLDDMQKLTKCEFLKKYYKYFYTHKYKSHLKKKD